MKIEQAIEKNKIAIGMAIVIILLYFIFGHKSKKDGLTAFKRFQIKMKANKTGGSAPLGTGLATAANAVMDGLSNVQSQNVPLPDGDGVVFVMQQPQNQ